MGERISGTLNFLDGNGDCVHEIDVRENRFSCVGGEFGAVIVDTTKKPSLVQTKGDLWIVSERGKLIRTARIKPGEEKCFVNSPTTQGGFSIGKLSCVECD